jgi:DNA adenine methylase
MPYDRSFLKWAGGKYKLLDNIASFIPANTTRTIEPFAGSAVFSLNLGRGKAIVNDVNSDLIDLYMHASSNYALLLDELKALFVPPNNTKEAYIALRKEFNETATGIRKAALFVYLNKHCFNGLVRYNKSDKFNTPFGSYKSVSLPEKELERFAARCKGFTFLRLDFSNLFTWLSEGDFCFADPPFAASDEFETSFVSYTKNGFSAYDQQQLVHYARQARDVGATMAISNHYTAETADLYSDADHIEILDVGRSISAKSDKRITVKECLAVYGERS